MPWSWPACGEIDIMEHGDGPRGLVSSTVHLQNADGNHRYVRGDQTIENEASAFHIYRMDWSENRIEFFVDDVKHHGFNLTANMPFHQPFYFILNIAMGGDFTNDNVDINFSASAMKLIAFVCINKKKKPKQLDVCVLYKAIDLGTRTILLELNIHE